MKQKKEIIVVALTTIVLFYLFAHLAHLERGYSGIGGEAMALLLPVLYYQFKPKIEKKTKNKKRYRLVTPQQYKSLTPR